jgi:hypothetical protein
MDKKEFWSVGIINLTFEMQNNITYWYPVLQKLGIPTPHTVIVHNDIGNEILKRLDNEYPEGYGELYNRIMGAINLRIGYPCILKTGLLSNKHDWQNSCYITKNSNIHKHILNLVEASCLANIAGQPFDLSYFAVRKIIPTIGLFTAFQGEMPITKERRLFAKGGKVICEHPYWPKEAFELAGKKVSKRQYEELWSIKEKDLILLKDMSAKITSVLEGYWSIDFMQDNEGNWWCIDMARGEQSYHWPDCLGQIVRVKEKKQ